MNRIRILPDQVANQIAAGEVIERPASVLKELVENAIDAQATSIRIEIRGGGKSTIRITDNGHGMSRDDALLCIERHATSKIHDSADIGSIHTLGFRGEAIPSIASVSRFRLLTKEPDTSSGTEIDIHGGKLLAVKDAGCAPGTQVEVRNLFYNLPARRKFLRSDATELGHLHHTFLLHAIAQPHIGWVLHQDERIVYELPAIPVSKTQNAESALLDRVRGLHGAQLASQLLPVRHAREGVRLHGLIGKPGLSRSNRSELYTFVNSRPVDSRAIYYGLIEGYHSALMRGRYPVCFLFLEIDPALVDVNIHPAKREVRFREDARVQGVVIQAVREALGSSGPGPQAATPLEMKLNRTRIVPSRPPLQTRMPATIGTPTFSNFQPTAITPRPGNENVGILPSTQPASISTHDSSLKPAISNTIQDRSLSTFNVQPSNTPFILGVLAKLYVIALDGEGLLIVDQHAAHERILFEQMMSRVGRGQAPSQRLLFPQTIDLPPRDATELKEHLGTLQEMGFGVAEFGDRSFIIDALPSFVKVETLSELMRSILDELQEAGRGINRDRFAEETVAKTVCRHAVKANDALRPEELQRMLVDLQACENPLTCPHGRPTMLRLTQAELERKFGRRPIETL